MTRLVALSLRFRVLVLGAAVVVMALGVLQLRDARVDALPEFSPVTVTVQAEAVGLSAAEVEQYVTLGLEQDLLNGVPWIEHMESESASGYCRIALVFRRGTDPLKARQAVQERLTQAYALPAVGTPPVMLQPLSSTSRVMMVGLSSRDLSLTDLAVLARWRIKPRLMGVPGVADVSVWGQRDRQMQVQVDPNRLRQNGITLDQVIATTGNALFVSPLGFLEASTPGTGGFVDTATQRLAIQHVLPVTTAKDLAQVTIEDSGGKVLRLSDVASVVEDHQPFLVGDAVLRNGPGLMLVIQKFPEANSQNVTRGVEDALAAMRPGLTGVTIDTNVYRVQSYIDTALHDLGATGVVSLLLLLLVLGVVLYSWRMALIAVVSTLLALVTASYVLYLLGVGFNLMVLAGLAMALGVVIDDAVVDAGVIGRRLREQRLAGSTTSIRSVITEASTAVRGHVLTAMIVALVAPLPLIFLDGVAGSFARPAVLAYALAVAASTLVALAVVPVLASTLLAGAPSQQRVSPVVRLGQRMFDRIVTPRVTRPRVAYALAAGLLVVGVGVVPLLTTRAPLPTPQDRNILVHEEALPGTSLREMDRVISAASSDLRAIPGVDGVAAHVGRALNADEHVDVNTADMWVSLRSSADHDATVTAVQRALRGYPGLRSQVETYAQVRVDAAAASGPPGDLTVRVYGVDLATLQSTAEQVRSRLTRVAGVEGPEVRSQPVQPTLQVEVDLTAAQRYGLLPGDVRRAASTFFSGTLVGNLYQEQRIFDVVVWGAPQTRRAPTDLADLQIDTSSGGKVRLGDVATVRIVPSPTALRHDNSSRYVDVSADVSGRDLDAVLRDVRSAVAAMPMPLEYHAEVLSDLLHQRSQDGTMLALAISVAILIVLLLQASLGSWALAGLAFAMLPLSLVGGVLANLLTGGELSLAALLGLFTVLGLAARQISVLVDEYRRNEGAEGERAAMVLRVTRERIGPILATVLTTAAVLVPVVAAGSRAGTEVLYPMSVVVLGGLATSTLVTLILVPALYLSLPSPVRTTTGVPSWMRLRVGREREVGATPLGGE